MYTRNNEFLKENVFSDKPGKVPIKKEFETRELSCFIEREDAINKLTSFLEHLQAKKRGLLRIVGSQGSGRTCFLNKAAAVALKFNYIVISVCKDGFIKAETDEMPESSNKLSAGKFDRLSMEHFITNEVMRHGKAGLVLLMDDIGQAGSDTLMFLSQLLERKDNLILALICSSEPRAIQLLDFIDMPINNTLYMEPLSPRGLCLWLKRALDWEPPQYFTEWLYNETQGLPGYIHEGIAFLLRNRIILHDEVYSWIINKDYSPALLSNKSLKKINIPKNNLPAATMEFIGRENEIDKISSLLDTARLVSLIGPGGIGKTSLSIQTASRLLCNYKDGVFWISLATVAHRDLLISNITKVLNIPESKEHHSLDSIKSALRDKKLLLILDNFEQIICEAPAVSELLASAPGLSVLVTSREPLSIYGEHVFYVPPLELPDTCGKVPVETLERQPSVALFLSRARAVRCDFILTSENATLIAELCARLEGIPLAIELAAANIGQVSIESMLSQSKNRLRWLRNGARDLPGRQRTLRNTITWGIDLLTVTQKRIFSRLGAFKGAFDLEAANKIANFKHDLTDISGNLLSLVNKSILLKLNDLKGSGHFFNMLEIIREYAMELLSKSNEEKYIKDCHADYFLSLAVEAENKINGPEYQIWLDKLDLVYPDILEALEHLQNTGSIEKELKLAGTLGCYWHIRGYWSKGQSVLEQIIKKCDNSIYKQYFVKVYMWYGCFVNLRGNYEKALQIYETGLELAHMTGDSIRNAAIRHGMSLAARKLGNYIYAEELMQQSLCIYREIDHRCGTADVLQDLGELYYFKGDYHRAEKHSKESMEISTDSGDKYRISKALGILGLTARGKGNYTEALHMLHRYLKSCEELNDRSKIADALMNIAEMTRSQGDYELAQDYYLKCLDLGRELGYMSIIARVLKELGEINRCKGNLNKACELFEESLTVLRETGEKGEEIWVYRNMAELELERGNSLKAEELFVKGIKVYLDIKINTLIYVFLVIEGLAGVSLALGQLDRAACLMGAADRLYKITGNLPSKSDIAIYKKRLGILKQKMNEADFQKLWTEGNLMSFEHALDYAVKTNDYRYDKTMASKMINYIHENYAKDISLNDISEYFNMSTGYLSTMFKYYTGQNYKDYLTYYRVKTAKELLKAGNLKINEVYKKVGCSNAVTFIRMFKKYEGMSPSQYCEQMRKYR